MATARTCKTPEEGWSLFSHFLSNRLLAIRMQLEDREEVDKAEQERRIADCWANLVGNLYMIMRCMIANGHDEDAKKMQKIIDMTIKLDLKDPETHKIIHNKHKELDPKKSNFKEKLARLK